MLSRPTSPGLVHAQSSRVSSGEDASGSRVIRPSAVTGNGRGMNVAARASGSNKGEFTSRTSPSLVQWHGGKRGDVARAEAYNKDKLGSSSAGSSDWKKILTQESDEVEARAMRADKVKPRAIMDSARDVDASADDEDGDVAFDVNDLSAMEAQMAKLLLAVDETTRATDASAVTPTLEELAMLEKSLMDDDEANASVDIPEREKLTPKKTTRKTTSQQGTTRSKASARASSSLASPEDKVEVESGVVTTGLAARSARARAVARGVRSRPTKTSVSQMVQAQTKERVRGVNLEPRKVQKQSAMRIGNKRPSTDSMRSYLKDIGSVTLLNAGQEVELAKRIQDLMHLESIRENLIEETGPGVELSESQWAAAAGLNVSALRQRLHDGKAAKNEMIQANLRLVVSIAKKYANTNMSFQDLIQEGCVGLIRGAEKFDFQRGYKFSTYAHWWIRQAVTRSISDQSRTIRLPVHLFEIISRISKMEQKFALYNGRPPTLEEIASEMEMSVEKITQIKKAAQAPVSLAQTMGGENKGRTIEDTLIDANAEGPEKVSGKSLLKEDLENVLNTLNPRERDVLRLRYGLDDGRVKTLEEIGTVFSVTRERIRQIEAKALRKLKQPSRNQVLQEYFVDDAPPNTHRP